jgi:hypothetical protein
MVEEGAMKKRTGKLHILKTSTENGFLLAWCGTAALTAKYVTAESAAYVLEKYLCKNCLRVKDRIGRLP